MKQLVFALAILLIAQIVVAQSTSRSNYLLLFHDAHTDSYGYKDRKGNVVIKPNRYSICFTDTFRTYAVVLKPRRGYVAINRKEQVLYEVFPFDNGPDYAHEGLFRMVVNGKIGYANAKTGNVVIAPTFSCAFPFSKGVAKVSLNCTEQMDGEHRAWESKQWYYIDKKGKKAAAK